MSIILQERALEHVFFNDNIRISITENGIHNNGYEYKHGITYSGVQGTYNGLLTIDVKYDYPDNIYFFLRTNLLLMNYLK